VLAIVRGAGHIEKIAGGGDADGWSEESDGVH